MKTNLVTTICLSSLLFFNTGIAAETTDKTQSPEATPSKSQSTDDIATLKSAALNYAQAWHKQDFKTMYGYEDWEGGPTLDEAHYIRKFDIDFKIQDDLVITQVNPLDNGEYNVLVLVSHNVSKRVAAFVPKGKTVKSTLNQIWKKKGNKFVHLFHIERERLMPTQMSSPPPK